MLLLLFFDPSELLLRPCLQLLSRFQPSFCCTLFSSSFRSSSSFCSNFCRRAISYNFQTCVSSLHSSFFNAEAIFYSFQEGGSCCYASCLFLRLTISQGDIMRCARGRGDRFMRFATNRLDRVSNIHG